MDRPAPSPAETGRESDRSVSAMWIGRPLGRYEELALLSFAQRGYRVQLFTIDPGMRIPDGVDRCDVGDVLPVSAVYENPRERGTFAQFSNRFRYSLIQQQATTWIDSDVVLVGDGIPSGPYVFGYQGEGSIAIGVLRAPPESALVTSLVEESFAMSPPDVEWGQMGPNLLTTLVERLSLSSYAQPREVFYPIRPLDVWMLFDPAQIDAVDERIADSSTVHLWNELLRRAGPITLLAPPEGSWLDRQMHAHGIASDSSHRVDADWVCDALGRNGPTTRERLARVLAERDRLVEQRDRVRERLARVLEHRDQLIEQRDQARADARRPRSGPIP